MRDDEIRTGDKRIMTKFYIGLNRYRYTYPLKSRKQFLEAMSKRSETGEVTEVFMNNRLAFEYRKRIWQ